MPTTITGRVTEFDPPRLFGFTGAADHLRFELVPVAGRGCVLLRLTVLLDAATRQRGTAPGGTCAWTGSRRGCRVGRAGGGRGLARAL